MNKQQKLVTKICKNKSINTYIGDCVTQLKKIYIIII